MAKDTAIVTIEGEYELVCGLSNGAISNYLERTLTLFSRSRHVLFGAKYLTNGYRYGHSYYRPEQTNTYTWNSMILSLKNVTDRQKSPVFCCKKSGNPTWDGSSGYAEVAEIGWSDTISPQIRSMFSESPTLREFRVVTCKSTLHFQTIKVVDVET